MQSIQFIVNEKKGENENITYKRNQITTTNEQRISTHTDVRNVIKVRKQNMCECKTCRIKVRRKQRKRNCVCDQAS